MIVFYAAKNANGDWQFQGQVHDNALADKLAKSVAGSNEYFTTTDEVYFYDRISGALTGKERIGKRVVGK
jgi:hypothetical protein